MCEENIFFKIKGKDNNYYYNVNEDYYIGDKDYYFFKSLPSSTEVNIARFLVKIYYINQLDFDISTVENYHHSLDFIAFETIDGVYLTKPNNGKSLIKRIIENLDYSLMTLLSEDAEFFFHSCFSIFMIDELQDYLVNDNINGNQVLYYNKKTEKYESLDLVHYPDKKSERFSDIYIENFKYDYSGTGLGLGNKYSVKKIIGPLAPVYKIEMITNPSNARKYAPNVYKSFSGRSIEENIYSVHGGKGENVKQAVSSAYGEACERYSSRMFEYDESELIKGSYNDLKKNFNIIDPKTLCLDTNFPNVYDDNKTYEWIEIYELKNNREILFPANDVFFPYNRSDNLIMHSQSTTGISAERTLSLAILKGMFEVLERDAYSITHRANVSSKRINSMDILDKDLRTMIYFYEQMGFKFHIHALSTFDFIYVIHVTLEFTKFPIYTHGSAASLDINTAIRRAVFEAFQLRESQLELENQYYEGSPYTEWGLGNKEYCKVFLNTPSLEKENLSNCFPLTNYNIKKDIDFLVNQLFNSGYNVYVANLSRDDISLKCVKVIIPGLQDIDNYLSRITNRLKDVLLQEKSKINTIPMFS